MLVLRSQRDAARVVAPERGILRVEGEQAWAVQGPKELVDAAFDDLRDVGRRVHDEVIHLDFGNAVGVFRVRGLGSIEVVSGKWNESHFDAMLSEIARIASALPFAAGTAGPLPYDRAFSARDDLLYHAYVYLRHILSDSAPRHVRLLPALNAILAEPHRRADTEAIDVPPEQLRRVDTATILSIASAQGPLVHVRGRGLPGILRGHLPARVRERQYRATTDTPENRFVKAFLDISTSIFSRMTTVLDKDTRFSHRVRAECRSLEALIAPLRRHPLWHDVGTMTQLPANSTVLQRRRGYRDIFRHFVLLRLAARHLPISAHEARDLLEGKDIATLYEMWCYFQVVDHLTQILGPPDSVDVVARTDLQVHVAREFEVRWPGGVRALYNATFSRSKGTGRTTYSLPLRPDVVLILPDGTVHVLDAKFKLEWMNLTEDEVDRATVKLDDVYKMHAYRDAIEAAQSAWVLYPGTEAHAFTPSGAAMAVDGVGAIPLRPEPGGQDELRALLLRMLKFSKAAA